MTYASLVQTIERYWSWLEISSRPIRLRPTCFLSTIPWGLKPEVDREAFTDVTFILISVYVSSSKLHRETPTCNARSHYLCHTYLETGRTGCRKVLALSNLGISWDRRATLTHRAFGQSKKMLKPDSSRCSGQTGVSSQPEIVIFYSFP